MNNAVTSEYSEVVDTARSYYNSDDADNFYFHIWGGEDIHIGLYQDVNEPIADASQRTVATLADHLQLPGNQPRVIDLGSGYGGAARWLAGTYGCHVSCINLSEAQNDRNRQLNTDRGLADLIEVIDGSFEVLPFEENSFDIAWSQDAILHSGQREQVLNEVNRVLKPGSEFIFTDPMQADDCPPGVLQPVLDRIHLETLGSFAFYRETASKLGWQEVNIIEMTPQLVRHYTRVLEELVSRRHELENRVSHEYIERMQQGLKHWIDAGQKGYLAWGIMHFRLPSA
ncbi:MAG: methyltransferase domain-containing protein [Thiotrichales bacterium]|nr:methyltransferase domain-containing protein [Thiotrichales bacterium]